jgi:hypothetical protein
MLPLTIDLGALSILMTAAISPLIPIIAFVIISIFVIIKDYRIGTLLVIIFSFTNIAGQQIFESCHIYLVLIILTVFSFMLSYLRGNTVIKGVKEFNLPNYIRSMVIILRGYSRNHKL